MQVKNDASSRSGRRYWLMKTEPGCFSLADLRNSPGGIAPWDGVRNYQARNLLRDQIRVGDGVLFYHSNIAEPAIVGIARVVRGGYPDVTALNPQAQHFDPRATEAEPIWYMVDVEYVAELPRPLTRAMLNGHPLLRNMTVMQRGNRLSVQEVTAEEWRAVLAVAGYNDVE